VKPTPAQKILHDGQVRKLESALWQRLDKAGLPRPTLEYRFAANEGRRYRFDGAYVLQRLGIEVEGGIWANGRHTRGPGYDEDCRKYSLAAALGWRVVRCTDGMILDGSAVELIARALECALSGGPPAKAVELER
jgi:hypothetical protein